MAEQDQKIKSENNIEATESFEEKIAKIKAILEAQKEEVSGIATGEQIKAEAPSLLVTSAVLEVEEASKNQEGVKKEKIKKEKKKQKNKTKTTVSNSTDVKPSKSTYTWVAGANTGVETATVLSNLTEISTEAKKNNDQKKKPHTKRRLAIIIVDVLILLLILLGIGYALVKPQVFKVQKTTPATALSSSSKEKLVSSSSKKQEAESSSTQQSAAMTNTAAAISAARSQDIASVSAALPGQPYLDPAITGQEAAFNWPAGLQTSFLANMQAQGRISGSNYKLIPAQIVDGQGWVNLYDASGKYVASIDLMTGYILE